MLKGCFKKSPSEKGAVAKKEKNCCWLKGGQNRNRSVKLWRESRGSTVGQDEMLQIKARGGLYATDACCRGRQMNEARRLGRGGEALRTHVQSTCDVAMMRGLKKNEWKMGMAATTIWLLSLLARTFCLLLLCCGGDQGACTKVAEAWRLKVFGRAISGTSFQ